MAEANVRRVRVEMACVKMVEGGDSGIKHYTGQYLHYWHCIVKSVAPTLFDKLK
ncbi:cytochrome b-c1 complex subunit 6 [Artemisia annua]|uniref:Cytochrome b-c1 complex subunit 6 n=1 Tax=Artemisia annua TaxID=35608 RepID=A0A2U1N1W3_ARTAN|nr:cytochrome b-c1 complex subunit 6 [Artemisia annua]